ncbi:hypothetical protein ACFVT5_13785 [Streptomyces sp. NPDC058001]|uniref:hypothetical protein n=1 Tax=Streptomyces sp. NPDC058001 TaxID=3346300 RepID=UPI0036EA7049
MEYLDERSSHEENLEIAMGIGRTAALLVAATGTVVLGAGGADASGGGDDGPQINNGAQINNCNSVSLVDIIGGPTASCLNFDEAFGKHHGPQVNNCNAVAALSAVGNVIFFPIEDAQGPSASCANIRR